MNKLIKTILLLLIIAITWGGYIYFKPKEEVSYITEAVKRGKISQTVSATGEISSTNLVDVGAQVSGQVKKMYVKMGDTVKQGDLIAEIDSTTQLNTLNTNKAKLETYQAQLASAQIALRTAERKYQRYQTLVKEGAVSQEDFNTVEDSLAAAQAQVKEIQSSIKQTKIAINTSEADLGYTRITAPNDGTVVAVMAEEGQTVNANQSTPDIVQIANLDLMLNKMQIAEGDITKVKAGQEVSFTILSEPDTPIITKLDSIDPGLTTMSQGSYSQSTDTTSSAIYYYARATVANPDRKLAIGMTTQNTIEIAHADNVLIVPTLAIKDRDGKKIVRVLGANKQVTEKEVVLGLKDSMHTEIKSGINEGEQVIISELGANEKANNNTRMGGPPM